MASPIKGVNVSAAPIITDPTNPQSPYYDPTLVEKTVSSLASVANPTNIATTDATKDASQDNSSSAVAATTEKHRGSMRRAGDSQSQVLAEQLLTEQIQAEQLKSQQSKTSDASGSGKS